jgi:hypothetical protein
VQTNVKAEARRNFLGHRRQLDAKKNSKAIKPAFGGPITLRGNKKPLLFFRMPTPLLAFLNDLEDAVRRESAGDFSVMWNIERIVNYHHGLARMTLSPPPAADPRQRRGAIFLQSIPLADGNLCFKANLNWHGSDAFPVMTVHSKPRVTWEAEALQIAKAWLMGPPNVYVPPTTESASPLVGALE